MSKVIRLTFVVIALVCVPMVVFPDLGMASARVSPLAVMFLAGAVAILCPWSGEKETERDL